MSLRLVPPLSLKMNDKPLIIMINDNNFIYRRTRNLTLIKREKTL